MRNTRAALERPEFPRIGDLRALRLRQGNGLRTLANSSRRLRECEEEWRSNAGRLCARPFGAERAEVQANDSSLEGRPRDYDLAVSDADVGPVHLARDRRRHDEKEL